MSPRWMALAALAVGTLTVSLDTTVLKVALPTLAADLGASTAQLQWFSAAYTLALAVVLLPVGILGDRVGRKRLLLVGLTVFGIASAACAYSSSPAMLIAARAALGVGAAAITPMSIAVLPTLFPDEAERGRAASVWVAASALGLPLGPILGGWLLDTFWWGSVFLLNVPLTLISVIVVAVAVPASHGDTERRLDPLSVALSAAGLVAVTWGVITAGQSGWNATAIAAIMAGMLLLLGFAMRERHSTHPLLDRALLTVPRFRAGAGLSALVYFILFGVLFALPLYFQAVEGTSALGTGLRLLPMILGLVAATKLAEKLAAATDQLIVIAVGFGLLAISLVAGLLTGLHTPYTVVATWMTVLGAGLGFAMPTAMTVALSTLPADHTGSGSALISALRQLGGALGVAVLGSILHAIYTSSLTDEGLPPPLVDQARTGITHGVTAATDPAAVRMIRTAFVDGLHGLQLVATVTAVIAASTALWIRRRTPRTRTPSSPSTSQT